jgi:hypothetical protein
MSTRCVINFGEKDEQGKFVTAAKIYRHCDGYPGKVSEPSSGILADMREFFAAVKAQCGNDTRFNDPCYLAAKFVVWQSGQYTEPGRLDFLSVGVVLENPSDIEHEYFVACTRGFNQPRPKVTHKRPARG